LPISARAIGELTEILPCFDVGLIVTDNLIAHFVAGFCIDQFNGGAKNDASFDIQMARIDDLRIGQLAFQILDAPFDEALLFLGRVVFGVFGQSPCERASAIAAITLGRSTLLNVAIHCAVFPRRPPSGEL
jgi:hypothetical protein